MPFYIQVIIFSIGSAIILSVVLHRYFEARGLRVAQLLTRTLYSVDYEKIAVRTWLPFQWSISVQFPKRSPSESAVPALLSTNLSTNAPPLAMRGSTRPDQPTIVEFGEYFVYYPPENLDAKHALGVGIPKTVPLFVGPPSEKTIRWVPVAPVLAPVSGTFYPAKIDEGTNFAINPREVKRRVVYRNPIFTDFLAKGETFGIIIQAKDSPPVPVLAPSDAFVILFGCYAGTKVVQGANLLLVSPVSETEIVLSNHVGTYFNRNLKGEPVPGPGDFVIAGTSLGVVNAFGLDAEELLAPCDAHILRQLRTATPVDFHMPIMLLQKL
ncbi:MAG: hypothetical protein WCV85_03360 [Patescibacteria group bacterium]